MCKDTEALERYRGAQAKFFYNNVKCLFFKYWPKLE